LRMVVAVGMAAVRGVEVAGMVAVGMAVAGMAVDAWASISAHRLVLTMDIIRIHSMGHRTMARPIIIRRRPRITLRCNLCR